MLYAPLTLICRDRAPPGFKYVDMKRLRTIIFLFVIGFGTYFFMKLYKQCDKNQVAQIQLEQYADVLTLHQLPRHADDRDAWCFSDKGAWHGYGLVPDSLQQLGFTGPFIMGLSNGYWLSPQLLSFTLWQDRQLLHPSRVESHFFPGYLAQEAHLGTLVYQAKLHYSDSLTAIMQLEIINKGTNVENISLRTVASPFNKVADFAQEADNTFLVQGAGDASLIVAGPKGWKWSLETATQAKGDTSLTINAGDSYLTTYTITWGIPDTVEMGLLKAQGSFTDNYETWQKNVHDVITTDNGVLETPCDRLAVKSLVTLVSNWRHALGDLPYAGLFPSYNYKWFNGFWAWDSWKHSVALARFAPELAKDQIRTLFAMQDTLGMIPDVIYADKSENNWRNTKPPLATWAVSKIFKYTNDTAFVREMLPKLEKYHQWWYNFRDVDADGLCEYGCTDGTLIAAKWESGMDNAVRFDNSQLIAHSPRSWSLNQESVDLNAFLAAEKHFLQQLSTVAGNIAQADRYANQRARLQQQILDTFWDDKSQWFYDKSLDGTEFIGVKGPEGWIPLWAEVATPQQATEMVATITDTAHFATPVPFPTVDYGNPEFAPSRGYWRGPVWVDQVYFATSGLRKYGYAPQADTLQQIFMDNAKGVLTDMPLRENYHPLTGEGLNARHFSWTAAHLLMMLHEE